MSILPRGATAPALWRSLQSVNSTRRISSSVAAMASKPRFSDGSDEVVLTKELDNLISRRWALTDDGQGIERSFKFKTFAKTWVSQHVSLHPKCYASLRMGYRTRQDFMTAVSLQCKLKNHHPEWSNVSVPACSVTRPQWN